MEHFFTLEKKVLLMFNILEKSSPATHSTIHTNKNPGKSLDRAEKLRQNGNKLFASYNSLKELQSAYACYAEGIAHAPAGSQEMTLLYSNLSAVLFRIKKFPECVQAIDFCLSSGYPEEKKLKIYLRKIECLKILGEPLEAKKIYDETLTWIERNGTEGEKKEMKKNLEDCYEQKVEVKKKFTDEEIDKVWNKFSIKSCNEEIPAASSAMELRYSESRGRHFVATRNIQPGEILLREQPYLMACSSEYRYISCWECLEVATNCIPCDFCVNVIFCSEKCKEDAWKKCHQMECQVLSYLYESFLGANPDNTVMAFKMLLLAIKEYGSVQDLKKAVQELESKKDPRTAGFTLGQLVANKYAGVHSLSMRSDNLSANPIVIKMIHYAVTKTIFGDSFKKDSNNAYDVEDLVFAVCLMVQNIKKIYSNIFKAGEIPGSASLSGSCLLIAGSLFNHSCFPNAHVEAGMPYTESLATLPIKKGEEICINYLIGINCTTEQRQTMLQCNYEFVCNCVACVNNWPDLSQYPNILTLPRRFQSILNSAMIASELAMKETELMNNIYHNHRNYKSKKKTLDKLSDSIVKLSDNIPMPCKEIIIAQISLIQFFQKLRSCY